MTKSSGLTSTTPRLARQSGNVLKRVPYLCERLRCEKPRARLLLRLYKSSIIRPFSAITLTSSRQAAGGSFPVPRQAVEGSWPAPPCPRACQAVEDSFAARNWLALGVHRVAASRPRSTVRLSAVQPARRAQKACPQVPRAARRRERAAPRAWPASARNGGRRW